MKTYATENVFNAFHEKAKEEAETLSLQDYDNLLYLAQGFRLARTGQPFIRDVFVSKTAGPQSVILHSRVSNDSDIKVLGGVDMEFGIYEEQEFIDSIWAMRGRMGLFYPLVEAMGRNPQIVSNDVLRDTFAVEDLF